MISSCGAWASHCGGFFCCRAWALGRGLPWLWCTGLVASQLPDHGWSLCHLQGTTREAPGRAFKCRSLGSLGICIFTSTLVVSDPC